MSTNQTIFITGASGYIGMTLTKLAISSGYTIHALSRSETSDAKLSAVGAIPIRGDITTHDVLTREAAAADIVINIADSIAGDYTIAMAERTRINNAAVDALVAGLKGTGKALIVTSGSLITAPDPEGKETDESSPVTEDELIPKMEEYALGKQAEGVKIMAVRLAPYVYGNGGSGVALFMNMFHRKGSGFYVLPGTAKITTVHVEDAARLYLLVAEKGRSGEKYNAAFETHVSQRELAEAIGRALGVEVHGLSSEEAGKQLGSFFAQFLGSENRASGAKAKRELGWEVTVKEGILEDVAKGSYVEVAEGLKNGGK